MTTVTDIAERLLTENGLSTTQIAALTAEYLVKNAVDYINLMAGTSISFTPVAGSENLVATDDEIIVVKFLTTLLYRAYLDHGGAATASVGSLTVPAVIADPQYHFYSRQLPSLLRCLTGRSFERT